MIFAPKRPNASWPVSLCTYAILIGALAFSWLSQKPANNAFNISDETHFSQQRALVHLEHITGYPHYTGSAQHASVKHYLVAELEKMGLEVHVQDAFGQSAGRNTSAKVANVIARLAGTQGDKANSALALVSHYDSATYASYGASDAASGVATILEALRAFIAQGQSHNNDILVIFTDGEEQGLLGAEAFSRYHPWALDIGLILNFEARGSGGSSFMLLETNGGNHALIKGFAQAGVNFPVANSLMYSIYKLLPNDTDLTVFREQRDINGFNFAFIDDHFDYHTAQDTVERLDPSSLNHQADYLTNLLPYFANQDLSTLTSEQDDVFFNFANLIMVQYPFYLAWPLVVIACILMLILFTSTFKQGLCSVKSLSIGALPAILSVVFCTLLGAVGWQLLLQFYPQYADIRHDFPYTGHAILYAFILFSVGITFSIYQLFKNRYSYLNAPSLGLFPSFLWLLLNIVICLFLLGANFFVIPLLGALLGLLHCSLNKGNWHLFPFLSTLFLLPGIIIVAPQIPTFVIGLGMDNLFIATLITSLLLGLLLPGLLFVRGVRWLSRICMLGGVALLVYGHLQAGYSEQNKKPTSVNYLYDVNQDRAFLFSYNQTLDSFTQQFFAADDINNQQIAALYPAYRRTKVQFVRDANVLPMTPASIEIVSDTRDQGFRTVEMRILPGRQNNMLQLATFAPLNLVEMSVLGQPFASRQREYLRGTLFRHVVTDMAPLNIAMTFQAQQGLNLRLIETRFDLPSQHPGFVPREPMYMPEPFVYSDATIISQRIDIPE